MHILRFGGELALLRSTRRVLIGCRSVHALRGASSGHLSATHDSALQARDGRPRYTAANAPVAIFHGTADTLVPFENALQIDAGYNASGVVHRIFPLAGQGHGCWNARTADNRTQDDAGFAFLAKVMGLVDGDKR